MFMKVVILEDFNKFDDALSVKYLPENNSDDLGSIKISRDGTVLENVYKLKNSKSME